MESDFDRFSNEKEINQSEKDCEKTRVGEIEVECVFGEMSLEQMLKDLIEN